MKLEIGEVIVEPTGFKPGDRIGAYVARVYLSAGFEGLRFAYGSSPDSAEQALLSDLDVVAEIVTKNLY